MADEQASKVEDANSDIVCTLKRKERKVKIDDQPFTLRELCGRERTDYMNLMISKVKTGTDGKPAGMKDFTGIESKLISLSLYDSSNAKVSEEVILGWPSSALKFLFEASQILSGLDQDAEATAKKS